VDLVWLTAQLDEDERIARAATPGPWEWTPETDVWDQNGPTLVRVGHDGYEGRDLVEVLAGWGHDAWGLHVSDADRAFIAAHDPARVLREIDAKQKIVRWHYKRPGPKWDTPDAKGFECATCDQEFPCKTLRLLASAYADRPGYEAEEWAP